MHIAEFVSHIYTAGVNKMHLVILTFDWLTEHCLMEGIGQGCVGATGGNLSY